MSNEQILLNKVLDASSNTIWDELKKIRESSVDEKKVIRRRWVWELIQNASDCTPKNQKIDISINYSNNQIIFSHNGLPFSYENLLDLITQISSKQSSEEKKTGKFGTGFMSTHLLSEIVNIEGSYSQNDGTYKQLNFVVDRSGNDYKDIKNKTKGMLEALERLNSTSENLQEDYLETKFIYSIEQEEILEAIEEGIKDLRDAIPYVLVFNENINSITYNNEIYKRGSEQSSQSNPKIKMVMIESSNSGAKNLLFLNENEVTIGCEVKFINKELHFLPFSDNLPRVFCEFPLLGTEKFSFPIIVNSKLFDVERDRNAIRDSNEMNMSLLKVAISLYKELLDYCSKTNNTKNVFNICLINKPINSVIQNHCYKELKEFIETSPIISIYNDLGELNKEPFKENSEVNIFIPLTIGEDTNHEFWQLLSNLKNIKIPSLDSYSGWSEVFNSNINFSYVNEEYLLDSDLTTLNSNLKTLINSSEWLNTFYSLWIKEIGIEKLVRNVYVPNQNGDFILFEKIYFDENIDEELKEILSSLGIDIKSELLKKDITVFEEFFNEHTDKKINNMITSNRIEKKVLEILSKETIDNIEREANTQQIFNKLTNWFISNQQDAMKWFENIYTKRMMLSSPEENLRRYKIAEKIENHNIRYEDLDDIINNREKIISILQDNKLSQDEIIQQLKHIVTSSKDLKLYVDGLIERSIKNVYTYLSKSDYYTLPETLEEWKDIRHSKTAFPAKYKEKDIRIVIRPSDHQQIIFYYEEEFEVLDDTEYQLWTDDGKVQRIITLGDLLKTTGISRIPLNNLWKSWIQCLEILKLLNLRLAIIIV